MGFWYAFISNFHELDYKKSATANALQGLKILTFCAFH
jgi:hypothetical protein